ncbi:MAG: hypothetical protein PHY85_03250 [Bacteroidales bacterium]|nr:hypothetical protein [Bacteroidales bacterium]
MTIDEIEKILSKLESIQQSFGVGWLIIILIIIIGGFILYKYFIKRTEEIAKEITEKNIIKFSSRLQKQIDAVQDCYQSFEKLQSFINFLINGEKYSSKIEPSLELDNLKLYRLEFKKSFNKNKLLFPNELIEKIESLFPEIDAFIEKYSEGILQENSNITFEIEGNEEIIDGFWRMDDLEPTLDKMDEINKSIIKEFRKIYGTDD